MHQIQRETTEGTRKKVQHMNQSVCVAVTQQHQDVLHIEINIQRAPVPGHKGEHHNPAAHNMKLTSQQKPHQQAEESADIPQRTPETPNKLISKRGIK